MFPSEKSWGRKEDAFGVGSFFSLPYMHFEAKPYKVLVNEVQASCELIAVFRGKRAIVYVKDTGEGE